jgi:hypothetical protein
MSEPTQDTPPVTLKRGNGTLSSGTVTITDSAMLTTSMIVLTDTNASLTNVGALMIKTKSNGSFVVTSTNILDSSSFDYVIMNP